MVRSWKILIVNCALVVSGFVLIVFGSLANFTGDKALAEEKIILKHAPYFHQKERLD